MRSDAQKIEKYFLSKSVKFVSSYTKLDNFALTHYLLFNTTICHHLDLQINYLNSYLKTAVKEYDSATAEIRKQDVLAVFASVYSESRLGVNVTLDFLISHYLTIYN